MKYILMMLMLMLMLMSIVGCGNSPLFNHRTQEATSPTNRAANSARLPGTAPAVARNARDCTIEFPRNGLCAALDWSAGPGSDQESAFTLQFFNKSDGAPRDTDNEVFVQLWMPAMGHGSSPTQVVANGGGVYTVTRVYFTMHGTWDLRIQLKKNRELTEQAIKQVEI